MTPKGVLSLELFEEEAPNAVANFIEHVEDGSYVGTSFHRVVRGFGVQGGDPATVRSEVSATRGFAGASGTIDYARGPVPAKDVWVVEVSAGTRTLASRVQPVR